MWSSSNCCLVPTFELLLPGAPGDEDQEGEELPEGDAAAAAHLAEDLVCQAAGHALPQHVLDEHLLGNVAVGS